MSVTSYVSKPYGEVRLNQESKHVAVDIVEDGTRMKHLSLTIGDEVEDAVALLQLLDAVYAMGCHNAKAEIRKALGVKS